MHRFNIDFSSDELSQKVGQRIDRRLLSAGLADRVKVTFVENGHGVPIDFDFEGSSEDVAKAKEGLGVPPEGSEQDRNDLGNSPANI
jgi:hypothetical protein